MHPPDISQKILRESWEGGLEVRCSKTSVRFMGIYMPSTVLRSHVLVSQCWVTSYYKAWRLRTTEFIISVSVGQEAGRGLTETSASGPLTGYRQGSIQGCRDLQARLGKDCSQAHSRGCWQDSIPHRLLDWGPQFFSGCWRQVTLCFLTCGLPPHNACFIRWNMR